MIKRVDKIFVYVADVERAKKFYEDVLGLKKAKAFEGDIAYQVANAQILLIPDRERGCPRAGCDACLWTDDMEADYTRLVIAGVHFFKPPTKERWGGWLAGLHDSEGNRIFLIQY